MACSKGPPFKLKGPDEKPPAAWLLRIVKDENGQDDVKFLPATEKIARAAGLPWPNPD